MTDHPIDHKANEPASEEWFPLTTHLDERAGSLSISRKQLRNWSLVLSAKSIPYRTERRRFGWSLKVLADDYQRAIDELVQYETENHNWPPPPPPETPLVDNVFTTIWVLIALAAFYDVTLSKVRLMGHWPVAWKTLGNAHAGKIMAGEWWRTATALTLHGDWQHLLGNLIIGGVFVGRLCRDLRSGLGWTLVLAAGMLGNFINAWLQHPDHRAVGASTAVFGTVGLLAAISIIRYRHNLQPSRRLFIPLAGAFGLLAMLGAGGDNTDLGAHLWGLVAGLGLGVIVEFNIERFGRPGAKLNIIFAFLGIALIIGAWWMALI